MFSSSSRMQNRSNNLLSRILIQVWNLHQQYDLIIGTIFMTWSRSTDSFLNFPHLNKMVLINISTLEHRHRIVEHHIVFKILHGQFNYSVII